MDLLLELADDGGGADLVVENGDLVLAHGLRSNVLGSLFCHARRPDPVDPVALDREQNPQGYWADTPAERFGSLLWRSLPARVTVRELAQLEQYARASLQWLVTRGIARDVQVTARRVGLDRIELEVVLFRAAPLRWQALWDAEESSDDAGRYRLRLLTT